VFATFALEDGLGSPLDNLATPATVKMRIPRDTWGVVKDIDAVAAGIQVPLYWFDEVKGTWIREGQGHLEDGDGATVPASALASIKDGSYAGALFAVGALTHFSSWNVDWPVETHGRIGGELGECWWNGERKPCAGATVTARGDSYTGTSTPQTVGDDGRFSIAVMRSEGPGEDLDGDGVTGEETDVALRAVWEGRVYDLGVTGMPATQATPGGGDTKDLGVLTLDDRPPNSNLLEVGLCTVTGQVLWSDGAPSVNATVWSWDDDIASDVWDSLCLVDPFPCTIFASTDPEGAFSVTTPTLGGPTLWALNTREVGGDARVVEFALGSRTYGACPSGPVSLTLDQGYVSVSATVELTANVVSWTPAAFGAAFIEVVSETGLKWLVATDGVPMSSPITYGSVPAGAIQSFPEGASPAPLASGDIIWVLVYGTTASGVPYSGGGELVVP
jgi:hypothetical protein